MNGNDEIEQSEGIQATEEQKVNRVDTDAHKEPSEGDLNQKNPRKGKVVYNLWMDDYEEEKLLNALQGTDEKVLLEVLKEIKKRGDLEKR